MPWDDGREKLDELIAHNKRCQPDEVIYECGEWHTSDGITWSNVDDEGNAVVYNPNGEDIIGDNISNEMDLESFDEWYADHFEELVNNYGGNAIAIIDEQVVAVEDTEKEAYDNARRQFPGRVPFVTRLHRESMFGCHL